MSTANAFDSTCATSRVFGLEDEVRRVALNRAIVFGLCALFLGTACAVIYATGEFRDILNRKFMSHRDVEMFIICLVPFAGVAISGLYALKSAICFVVPGWHTLFRRFGRNASDISVDVNADFEGSSFSGAELENRSTLYGREWILQRSQYTITLHRYDELLWAYKQRVEVKSHGIVTLGYCYRAVLHFSDGTVIGDDGDQASEPYVDSVLTQLARKCPAAFFGFDDYAAWHWAQRKYLQLSASVEARRRSGSVDRDEDRPELSLESEAAFEESQKRDENHEVQPLSIIDCPHCGTHVAVTSEGTCPSCRQSV